MSYKLGSLFDGSGGFPLSGSLCDIEPVWAAEVEPYPIAVTSSRFPNMKHLGDISKVNGAEIEPVDIITFGSPCQDLSVAGKRAGLKHEDNGDDETTRSGLFMEAVRIIKEMRKATNGEYPKFACWENVPGAFSSNNGQDFRIVLEELIKVAEPYAVMPEVPKNGWSYADSYSGDGWSLAYRVFDAQYWGVPQRRRRIYLVADFRGGCAEEILFEREGLRGYFTESRTQGQTVTPDVERSLGADDREGAFGFDRYNQCSTGDVSETVRCPNGGDNYPTVCYGISSYDSNAMKSSNPHSGVYEADTSRTLDLNGGNPSCNQGGIAIVENVPYTLKIRSGCDVDSSGKGAGKGALIQENKSATLATSNDQYLFQPIGFDGYNATETGDKSATLGVNCGMSTGRNGVITDTHILDDQGGSVINVRTDGKAPTLRAMMGGHPPVVMIPKSAEGLDAYNQTLTGDKAKTLNSAASDADHIPCAVYSVENHPADSRVNLDESGKVQCLTSRMGTGGGNVPMVMEEIPNFIDVEMEPKAIYTHPQNDTWTLENENKVQTLSASMGMGGGNTPLVMEPFCKSSRAKTADDATTWKHADIANTLNTFDQGEARANEVVVYAIDQQGGKGGANYAEDVMPTLCSDSHGTPHGVAYSFDPGASRDVGVLFIEECGKTLTNGTCPGHHDGVVIATNPTEQILRAIQEVYKYNGVGSGLHIVIDDENIEDEAIVWCLENSIPKIENDAERTACEVCAKLLLGLTYDERGRIMDHYWRNPRPIHSLTTGDYMQVNEEKTATLLARDYKDPTCVEFYDKKTRNYIVRRLTPTECARLQGFPDKWGHVEPKTEFADGEYQFWLDVRKTHDAINGRTVKDYNEKQMLAYYNKLWTDSAEYKMWGNGIALPCALYVLQGIKDALVTEQIARSKWLDELLGGDD